jgi:hypothetical protein
MSKTRSSRSKQLSEFIGGEWVRRAGLAAALATVGCGQSVEGEGPVTTIASALLTGTPTTARPEVGVFQRTGSSCTATLIDAQHALTAAHCLGGMQDVAVQANDSFSLGSTSNPSGVGTSRTISRIYSWGTDLTEITTTGWMSTDLALLRLSSPIAGVLPAGIAGVSPEPGMRVTGIGFGCTTSTSGPGTKNTLSYAYHDPHGTRVGCPGDSGGPRFFGELLDGGPIWAVVSGEYDAGPLIGWDIFGDAPWVKPQVEALIRKWKGTDLESEVDRPGLDYATRTGVNAAGCRHLCWANGGRCLSFSFVPATGTCWLKQGLADSIPRANIVSGLNHMTRPDLERGVDRPGKDYKSFQPNSPMAEECADYCRQDAACRSFTYAQPNIAGGRGRCYLKSEVPNGVLNASTDSGVKLGLEMETDRPGLDYKQYDTPNVPDYCQADCAHESSCRAWTWVASVPHVTKPRCYLKYGVPAEVTSVAPTGPRTISGVKGHEFF